jgi:hypothetical protein
LNVPAERKRRLAEAVQALVALGMPRAQQNDRSAVALLALLSLPPDRPWSAATAPLLGVTPIMAWARLHYGLAYAPNTRETFRRQTLHQLVDAGLVLYNPDKPERPVNSPKAVYSISPAALLLLQTVGSDDSETQRARFLAQLPTLVARYAAARELARVPVKMAAGDGLLLTLGEHSKLVRAIVEEFAPRFVPNSVLVYAGDTGAKWAYFDEPRLHALGVRIDSHGKMPDVVLHDTERNWLVLVEAVTSHGPVDGKRHAELGCLFALASAGLVYVTAFPTRQTMAKYLALLAWETEVWVADAPSHMIHLNGSRFLGPYATADR